MKRSHRQIVSLIAAFGVGVLLSILIPSEWLLIVTLVILILLAIGGSILIRG